MFEALLTDGVGLDQEHVLRGGGGARPRLEPRIGSTRLRASSGSRIGLRVLYGGVRHDMLVRDCKVAGSVWGYWLVMRIF